MHSQALLNKQYLSNDIEHLLNSKPDQALKIAQHLLSKTNITNNEKAKINFLISKTYKVKGDYNYIWFEGPNWPYNTTPMTHWLTEQKLLIKDETNGLATDEHMGIEAHKIVANNIINYINEKL
jgi:hypothetical protein